MSSQYDVIIVGGGPAGSSAAIHLATRGARVMLAEQKKFPRPKLCGEFISPECALHFDRLGVNDQMFAAEPARLTETVFYSRMGKSVTVPSNWFGSTGFALGLSRAEMDEQLLRRAAAAGVTVLEEAQAGNPIIEDGRVCGVRVRTEGHEAPYRAQIVIDASGRACALGRRLALNEKTPHARVPMVAFKAHLQNITVEPGACEIYFYRGGYGGLSSIENGLSNLCFIAAATDVRACAADANRVMREVVCQNRRARSTLAHARIASEWLAVSLEGFGRRNVAPAEGLLAVGDAASFIDPFTGSGMLMALESGELAARVITDYFAGDETSRTFSHLRANYLAAYDRVFNARLRICALVRKAAFVPGLAGAAIRVFATSEKVRKRLAQATRGSSAETFSSC